MAYYHNTTINPADLFNNAPAFAIPQEPPASAPSPRGVKRSREGSQDDHGADVTSPDDDVKPRKRGKPTKSAVSSPPPRGMSQGATSSLLQTPQVKNQSLVLESPSAASPPKSTPSKGNKALPSTRDHTTTQLLPSGDEYEPREVDEDGEKKITAEGELLGKRTYGVGTFTLVGRGDKLFMLATRCAQHLAYRDSYLLFTKNRSLYKIVASKEEKEEMIQKDIIPFAYRSRQIAVVTARSMFRQFGSRMVKDGHKVRDDYFETKARNQGFTEEDPAWLKRPGDVVKAKEVAPVPAQANDISSIGANAKHQLARGQVIFQQSAYGHYPVMDSDLPGFLQLGMTSDDLRPRDYGDTQRPRQDITGIPYTDRTAPSTEVEIVNQAAQATQVNSAIRYARTNRAEYLTNAWNTVHEIDDAPLMEAQTFGGGLPEPPPPQAAYVSPQASRMPQPGQQPMISQTPGSMMQPNSFARPHSMIPSPSPSVRASMPPNAMAQPMQRPNFNYNPQQQGTNFNYPAASNPMWPTPQASQASPMQQNQMSQYQPSGPSPSPHPVQQSPHPALQNPLSQSMGSSHGISSLGGYQGGGIPGMQNGPLATQNYLQQAQQRFGAGAQGMMRPGGFQPGAAAQQYMHNQTAGQNNMGMGAGIPGWNSQMGATTGQGGGQQGQQGQGGMSQQNWGNYGT